jgi:hypothetical protein
VIPGSANQVNRIGLQGFSGQEIEPALLGVLLGIPHRSRGYYHVWLLLVGFYSLVIRFRGIERWAQGVPVVPLRQEGKVAIYLVRTTWFCAQLVRGAVTEQPGKGIFPESSCPSCPGKGRQKARSGKPLNVDHCLILLLPDKANQPPELAQLWLILVQGQHLLSAGMVVQQPLMPFTNQYIHLHIRV